MNGQDIFLAHLGAIERVIAAVCRRHCLDGDLRDDFASQVKLRLIDSDYEILRKFKGRSSISTYLSVVITNMLRDFRVAHWGRWRASAAARRLGSVAMQLELLLYRDHLPVEQAIEVLKSKGGELPADAELRRLAMQLPPRVPTRPHHAYAAGQLPSDQEADADIMRDERERLRERTLADLDAAIDTLPAEDRLLVRLRYLEGFSVADIARTLHLEQKPLYRRIDSNLTLLRRRLESRGVDRDEVAELLDE